MPQLFFTWVQRTDKRVHFEFLDNSVPRGERPRTVAFGGNDTINVLDVGCMLDIERYRRVNINATAAEHLYADRGMLTPQKNLGFLSQCVERFRNVNFAEQDSGRIYLSIVAGRAVWADRGLLERASLSADTCIALRAIAATALDLSSVDARPRYLQDIAASERIPTLGRWSRSAGAAELPAHS